jgi:hypothetical protein
MPGSTTAGEPTVATKAPAGQPGGVRRDRPADPPSSAPRRAPTDEAVQGIGWRAIGIVAVMGALFGVPVPMLPSLLSGALLAAVAWITRTHGALTALIAIAAADAAMAVAVALTVSGSALWALLLVFVLNFTAGHLACVIIVRSSSGSGPWRATAVAVAVGALIGAVLGAILVNVFFGMSPSTWGMAINFVVELVAGILCMILLLTLFRQGARPQAAG